MELKPRPLELDRNTRFNKTQIDPQVRQDYGDRLCNMVLWCLHPDPARRYSIEQLRDAIRQEVERVPRNGHGRSIKHTGLGPDELLRHQPDKYASWCIDRSGVEIGSATSQLQTSLLGHWY